MECFKVIYSFQLLIGDHKQLQPIVMNCVAKGLGLDIIYSFQKFILFKKIHSKLKLQLG